MISYLTGTVFIFCYISFMYVIGISITKNTKSYPTSFIYGYLVYSFFVAVAGIPIQLLNLDWEVFEWTMLLVIMALAIVSMFIIYKKRATIDLKEFLKTQWFSILIAFILVFASAGATKDNWLCNNLDDGFYMGIVAGQPEAINGFNTNPASGFPVSSLGSYLVNTIFTEYSVFSRLFGLNPFILCHVFFAYFNYFLLCNTVHVATEYCFETKRLDASSYQFFSIVILIFGIPEIYLRDNSLLWVQDSWQFNTAMFYGSSIVRTMGSFLLILPFIGKKQLSLKEILLVAGISIVLISKSSIALPVIVLTCICYLTTHFLFSEQRNKKILAVFIFLSCMVIGFVLGNNEGMQNTVINQLNSAIEAYLSFFTCISLLFLSFFYKNENIYKINIFIIILAIFMFVDPINNIFEKCSIYNFVAARMLAMLIYMIVIMTFIYLIYGIRMIILKKRVKQLVYSAMAISITASFVYSNYRYNGLTGFYLQYKNPMFIPESTVELGELLETRYSETEQTNYIIMPERVWPYSIHHPSAVIIRSVSPNSISVSAALRYGNPEIGVLEGYTSDNQQLYYDFMADPNEDSFNSFKEILDTYPINCIVTQNTNSQDYLLSEDFYLYGSVLETNDEVHYYVYVKD